MAERTAHNGHIIDIFAGCLDQVGLLEMKSLANSTGGHMILTDSFASSMFRQSFVKIFEKDTSGDLLMGFGASLEVLTTKELKVTGLIDYVVSMNKKSTSVGETECGIGNPAPRRCVVSAPLPQSQLTLRLHRKRDLSNSSKGLKRVSYVPDLLPTFVRPIPPESHYHRP